jgi:hypothetical protein
MIAERVWNRKNLETGEELQCEAVDELIAVFSRERQRALQRSLALAAKRGCCY